MNKLKYEDIQIGQKADFECEITKDMMEQFCNISGDINPLHLSVNFAKKKGFKSNVVYGMLIASLYSKFAGVYIPGENCLLQSVYSDFCKPVYVGDKLFVEGKVVEKNDSVRQIILKVIIRNQYKEKVSRAKIEAGVI